MKQTRVILHNLPVAITKCPLLLFCILIDFLSLPFRWTENLFFRHKVQKQEIHNTPVFIIGHWRSGTTFLHQLLSNDPQFGYINFYTAMFPGAFLCTEKIMKPLLDRCARMFRWKIPFFNNIQYEFDFPCEEDTALLNMGSRGSAYWAYAFPKKAIALLESSTQLKPAGSQKEERFMYDYLYLLKKVSYKYHGKRLLLKSPPNTLRIRWLLKKFPGARFIYLKRDPVEVYHSHLRLWKQCMGNYALQKIHDAELNTVIKTTMKNIIQQYNQDKCLLDDHNLYEISYAKFIADPLTIIKEIYNHLALPGFADAEHIITSQIIKAKQYKPSVYQTVS
jgi:hypothetical protein